MNECASNQQRFSNNSVTSKIFFLKDGLEGVGWGGVGGREGRLQNKNLFTGDVADPCKS